MSGNLEVTIENTIKLIILYYLINKKHRKSQLAQSLIFLKSPLLGYFENVDPCWTAQNTVGGKYPGGETKSTLRLNSWDKIIDEYVYSEYSDFSGF